MAYHRYKHHAGGYFRGRSASGKYYTSSRAGSGCGCLLVSGLIAPLVLMMNLCTARKPEPRDYYFESLQIKPEVVEDVERWTSYWSEATHEKWRILYGRITKVFLLPSLFSKESPFADIEGTSGEFRCYFLGRHENVTLSNITGLSNVDDSKVPFDLKSRRYPAGIEHTVDDFLVVGYGKDRHTNTRKGSPEMDCYLQGGPDAFQRAAEKGPED